MWESHSQRQVEGWELPGRQGVGLQWFKVDLNKGWQVCKGLFTDNLCYSYGLSTWHMVGHRVHLDLKLLARREVDQGEGGGSAGDFNWGAPGPGACFPKCAVLDMVFREQGGDGRLPSQAHSVVLVHWRWRKILRWASPELQQWWDFVAGWESPPGSCGGAPTGDRGSPRTPGYCDEVKKCVFTWNDE